MKSIIPALYSIVFPFLLRINERKQGNNLTKKASFDRLPKKQSILMERSILPIVKMLFWGFSLTILLVNKLISLNEFLIATKFSVGKRVM